MTAAVETPASQELGRGRKVRPTRECARCGLRKHHRARGLCDQCLRAAGEDGTLLNYARMTTPLAVVVEEYHFFRSIGYPLTFREMAVRCGMTRTGADQAYRRAISAELIEREPYVQPPNHGPGPARFRNSQ